MSFQVIVTRDFNHMSEVAADIVVKDISRKLSKESNFVLGLATGNSPTDCASTWQKQRTRGSSILPEL